MKTELRKNMRDGKKYFPGWIYFPQQYVLSNQCSTLQSKFS